MGEGRAFGRPRRRGLRPASPDVVSLAACGNGACESVHEKRMDNNNSGRISENVANLNVNKNEVAAGATITIDATKINNKKNNIDDEIETKEEKIDVIDDSQKPEVSNAHAVALLRFHSKQASNIVKNFINIERSNFKKHL